MPDRAAIVTGASRGIGLAIARRARRAGLRPDDHRPQARPPRADGAVAARRGLRGRGGGGEHVRRGRASARSSPRTASASAASTCWSTTPASASAPPPHEHQTKFIDMQLDVNLRAIVLFYRECAEMLKAAGAEHRGALVVNLASIAGKSPQPWLSVYSATKAAVDRLHAGDEQGAERRRDQVGRVLPRVRRHRHDRVRQGPGAGRGDDPPRGHRRRACASCSSSRRPASCRRSCSAGRARACRRFSRRGAGA